MRRKLFFYVLILIVFVHILYTIDLPPLDDKIQTKIGETNTYYGKITSIKFNDTGNYKVTIKLPNKENVLISLYADLGNYHNYYSCDVKFSTKLRLPQNQRNPGCFDYQKYLRSIGIVATGSTDKIVILDSRLNTWERINKFLLIKKEIFLGSFENVEIKGFVAGVIFGDKELLEDNVYEEFQSNGTAHILAVSGLHIGILYTMVEKFLSKKQTKSNFIIISTILILFGCIASWTPSITRAIGMVFIKIIAKFTDRRYDILTSMSAIALISIVSNPYVIYNTGFQMSYLAVASIAFVMPHIPRRVPDFMAIIIAVNFGLIPYQMYQFNTFSFSSFFANIPIVYLAGIVVPIVAISFVLSFANLNVPVLEIIIESLSHLIIVVNRWCTIGLGSLDVVSPPLWIIAIFYTAVFFVLSEAFTINLIRKKYRHLLKIIVLLVTLSFGISILNFNPISEDEIVFVDVGQGDAVHIRAENKNILIDGGGSVNYNIGKNTLKPYILKNGTSKIDLALATHMHTDHYKGLEELYEEGLIEKLLSRLTANQNFYLAKDIWIETIWPLAKDINAQDSLDPNQDENKNCSVFMIHYKRTKVLITGDIDSTGEKKMLQYYRGSNKLKAHILKVGHHGSQYSTCDDFLEAVDPKFCVIQVGDNNYGHPHIKIIEKCRKKGIMVLRNDINGAIGFDLDDRNLQYHTMNED